MSKAKPKRSALALAAFTLFPSMLAACGGSDEPSGGSTTAAGGGGAAGNDNSQYVKYAQCMRKNGVPQWPDPVDGNKFRMPYKGAVDPNSPQVKAAGKKCESVRPPGWTARQDPGAQAQMLKYAQCMRKNGVPKFPDPQGGALDPGAVDQESPQFKAADQKCQELRPAGGGG